MHTPTQTTLRGICPAIREGFFPGGLVRSVRQPESKRKRPKCMPPGLARWLGREIDRDLAAVVNDGRKPTRRETMMILRFLKRHGYRPLRCQVHVGDHARRLYTAVDMLCQHRDKQRELLPFEVKVWSSDFEGGDDKCHMLTPFQDILVEPLAFAQLQLAMTSQLAHDSLPLSAHSLTMGRGAVLLLHGKHITLYQQADWAVAGLPAALARLTPRPWFRRLQGRSRTGARHKDARRFASSSAGRKRRRLH